MLGLSNWFLVVPFTKVGKFAGKKFGDENQEFCCGQIPLETGVEDAIAQHTIRDKNTSFGMYLPRMMVGKAVGLERVLTLSYSKNPLKNVS